MLVNKKILNTVQKFIAVRKQTDDRNESDATE